MKLKLFLTGALLLGGLSLVNPASAGNEESVHYFPASVYLENETLTFPNDLFVFEHHGNAYAPLRFMAESMGYNVQYDPNANSIHLNDMKNIVLGPTVDPRDAKLLAYEKYHVKSIDSFTLRGLNDEERKLMPDEAKNLTPIYYVLNVTDQNNENAIIYVSSNNVEHNFSTYKKQVMNPQFDPF